MTTHDQGTEFVEDTVTAQPDPGLDVMATQEYPTQDAAAQIDQPSETQPPETRTDTDGVLFADDELTRLTAQWDRVQAGFVDDPKECVQKADGLVSEVVEQLTTGLSRARSRLEEQWARGEEASTEDLRVALKQYREFFQRLLAA